MPSTSTTVAGALLAALLVSACGGGAAGDDAPGADRVEDGGGAAAEASSASPGSSTSGSGSAEPQLVDMVGITAGGGEVTTIPTPIDGELAQAAYLAGFDPGVRPRLRQAIAAVPAPRTRGLTATVVDIGCDSPVEVDITPTGAGYQVVAVPPPRTGLQCFAPVTSVALVVMPQ